AHAGPQGGARRHVHCFALYHGRVPAPCAATRLQRARHQPRRECARPCSPLPHALGRNRLRPLIASAPMLQRTRVLGVQVDVLTMDQAVAQVVRYLEEATEPGPPCRIVVTPNLDHAVQLQENAGLARAYQAASLILADGMPLVWASRFGRTRLPERVT